MKHANEINELLDSIIVCGESLVKIGRLLKEELSNETPITNEQDTPTKPIPIETKAATLTFVDVRKAFSAKSHAGYTAQVKELITKYGANRLSDVKEEDYPALMADLEVVK